MGEDFAKKTGEELGKKAGDTIWDNAKRVYGMVREKFGSNPKTAQVMQSIEARPTDQEAQAAVQLNLKDLMSADENFKNELTAIVKEIAESDVANTFFDTTILGDVQKYIQIGNVYGDVNL
jgi:hypothetical protein